ncbi:MAG: phosphopantetheine-binding protein, partial [Stellaceae bacterium]
QVRYRGAQTPAEERLGSIVAEVLGVPRIGSDDNFFLMGGHSLLATQVVLRARDAFGVDVTLFHIFEAKTVAKLATTIERLLIERLDAMSEEEAQRCLAV